MGLISAVDWIEIVGWIASVLTIVTYAMNTMIPLRVFAIGSSHCFVVYASVLQLWPLLAMELILLPINCYRFWQILSLRARVSQVSADREADFSIVKTYGKRRRFDEGAIVFERGDTVDQLYFLAKGGVSIEEIGAELTAGDIFGEIAFFTDAQRRTATARCIEESEIYEIDKKRFMTLQFEDPSFGLSVIRTIARRLTADARVAAERTPRRSSERFRAAVPPC